jgi:hypothetical protein
MCCKHALTLHAKHRLQPSQPNAHQHTPAATTNRPTYRVDRPNASGHRTSPPHATNCSLTYPTMDGAHSTSRTKPSLSSCSGLCRYTKRNLNCWCASEAACLQLSSSQAGCESPYCALKSVTNSHACACASGGSAVAASTLRTIPALTCQQQWC